MHTYYKQNIALEFDFKQYKQYIYLFFMFCLILTIKGQLNTVTKHNKKVRLRVIEKILIAVPEFCHMFVIYRAAFV